MSQVENPLLGKFRELLLERGVAGIKSIGVYWSLVNRRESSAITIQQFYEGIINHNMNLTPQEVTQLFGYFDRNGNGTIDYDEFLLSIRVVPPLNSTRMNMINRAFMKLDRYNNGQITVNDLRGVYNVKHHKKYLSGEYTEEQILRIFLDHFESDQHKDGIVTYNEFVNYYAGVSSSIDLDAYFDIMMRQSWKL